MTTINTDGVTFALNLFQRDGVWTATLFSTEPAEGWNGDYDDITIIAELSEGEGATPAEAVAQALNK